MLVEGTFVYQNSSWPLPLANTETIARSALRGIVKETEALVLGTENTDEVFREDERVEMGKVGSAGVRDL